MKKLLLTFLLLPNFICAEQDDEYYFDYADQLEEIDTKKSIEDSPEFRADQSGIPNTPTLTTTQANLTAASLQGVINSLIATLQTNTTVPNTTVPTSSILTAVPTIPISNPTVSSAGATPSTGSTSASSTTTSQTPQTITITTTITTNPTTGTTSSTTATNGTNTTTIVKPNNNNNNNNNNAHNGMFQKPSPIWTKPVIIDSNNHDFDNLSVIKFTENIVYKPSPQYVYPTTYSSYPAAIIVAKDNITIDLAGFNLSLDPSSAANFLNYSPIYGIAVYQGVKNLKIISKTPLSIKGSISGFSGYAIYMYGITQSYNSYDIFSNYIKNATIDNVLITQNVNGIYVLNGVQISISNTDVIYNYSPRQLFGISYINVLNGYIDSCKVNQNFSYDDVFGVFLTDTINVSVTNCEINANRSLRTGNITALQLSATSSTTSSSNEILNCNASRNLCSYATGKKSIGFNINNLSFHNIIEGCRATQCSHSPLYPGATAPTIAPLGIGFQIDGANSNQIFNNESVYNDTYGFSDTLLPTSTSFWTKNTAGFNGSTGTSNYNVNVPSSTGPEPLPTTKLYLNNLDAFTGAGPQLVNIEILLVAP